MAEDEHGSGRVGAATAETTGILVSVAPCNDRTDASGEGVEDLSTGLAQAEPVEQLAGGVAVAVPVEQGCPVTDPRPGPGLRPVM